MARDKNSKIENDWMRLGLAAAMYISCFAVALSVFQIPKEVAATGSISTRLVILLLVAAVVWVLVAYFSDEPAWRTVAKLIGYTAALCCVLVMTGGLGQVFDIGFGNPLSRKFLEALGATVCGGTGAVLINKLINSKLLN